MWRKIEHLRKQPKEVRNRYAFWYAFLITAMIMVVWASTLPARFDVLTQENEGKSQQRVESGLSRAWADLKATVVEGVSIEVPAEEVVAPAPVAPEPISADQFIASSSPKKQVGTPILIDTTTASGTREGE